MAKSHITIPKRIAGIKIPRKARKGAVRSFLSSPGGQLILVQAMLALAAVLATAANPKTRTGRRLRELVAQGTDLTSPIGGKGKRKRVSAAAVEVAIERAISALRAALQSAYGRRRGRELSVEVQDLTVPAEAGKRERTTVRSDIRH
jgi:hypothetical protein